MTTTTLTPTATQNLASYASTYASARNGVGVVVSQFPWIGQYRASASQFELNLVMASFDPTALGGVFDKASLILTVDESYGTTTVEVREHDWPIGITAWVPGAGLAAKRLVGSAQVGPGGQRTVTIPLVAFDLTKQFKILLTIADQTNGVAPTGDTTLLVSSARLDVTTALGRRPHRSFGWL